MGDNSREFSSLVGERKSDDVCGIHPEPVQAVDDSSGRTATVIGTGSRPTTRYGTFPVLDTPSSTLGEVKKSKQETGGNDKERIYVYSHGGNGNVGTSRRSEGGLSHKIPTWLKLVLPILFVVIFVIAVPTVTVGLASPVPGDNEAKHDAYLGDMIMLFSVQRWFWLDSVLVKGEPALQDEQEVKLFSVACDSVKGYTTHSHIEPGHAFNVAAPFPILNHHLQDISNYFATASGNITVNMTVWSKDGSELSLCYFDCYNTYESFIQQTPKAKEKALNCTEYQPTAESMTVISDYLTTHPGYFFVAVAAKSPFSLQYTVDLWREEFNRSDYVAENCSVIGGSSCEIALLPNYDAQPPELCILAYYLTGLEDFITLQASTQHRFINFVLIVGVVLLVPLILICISLTSYYCYIRCKCGSLRT